jgi:ATP-dependent Clp protease adaptor protein ClpS
MTTVEKEQTGSVILTDSQKKEEVETPKFYAIILHNDPITPYKVVVDILREVFALNVNRASDLMYEAHTKDRALVVVLPKDFAETKVAQAMAMATVARVPLTFTAEPEK